MATYKVLQDIEAEDKLLGPLTLKQFIFAIITVTTLFCQFWLLTNMPTLVAVPFVIVLLPVVLVMGFLAAPISREQSNDIWLLARLQFLFRPRKRIWNQDGVSDLVTITVPKQIAHVFTNNLSQTEVKSRLTALANTVDSRGWAIKNVNTNLFAEPGYLATAESDRLIDPMTLPQEVPAAVVTAAEDILDTQNNPVAQHLDQLVQESTQQRHDQALDQMHHDPAATPSQQNYWFMNQPDPGAAASTAPSDLATFQSQQVVAPGGSDAVQAADETSEEEALASKFVQDHEAALAQMTDHMRTVQPLHNPDGTIRQQPAPAPTASADSQGQTVPNPAIIGLANNDDLNVATIARQAKQMSGDDDEVVISLHR